MASDSTLERFRSLATRFALSVECQTALESFVVESLSAEQTVRMASPAAVHRSPTSLPAGPAAESSPEETTTAQVSSQVPTVPSDPLERYEWLKPLGMGGVGEVWRVQDRVMKRTLAMKFLRADRLDDKMMSRFLHETQLTAQMQHPGIIPVYDGGRLPDGRFFYTMKEVHGRTLASLIEGFHAPSSGEPSSGAELISLRRLLDIFLMVCRTVAYAHACGVVHRDLKPENVMVGSFGEVLVLDWGIAKVLGSSTRLEPDPVSPSLPPPSTERSADLSQHTHVGAIVGTLAYMPPEQALGEVELLTPAADVFALGCMLYELLSGQTPYPPGSLKDMILAAIGGRPRPLRSALAARPSLTVPDELIELVERSLAAAPEDRFPHAGALASKLEAWLEDAQRRERALQVVNNARALFSQIQPLRERATRLRRDAQARLRQLPLQAPITLKLPGWELEDQAANLERSADLMQLDYLQKLRGALEIQPGLPEASQRLADHYQQLHQEAEARSDADMTAQSEVLLKAYDRSGRYAAYLKGEGALSLVTDPPQAEVRLYRYALRQRRLVPEPVGVLGRTPLHQVPLAQGSYLLSLQAPGCEAVHYPVQLSRQEHWDAIAPGDTTTTPLYLPRRGELSRAERYVPAGWFWTGGDAEAANGLPRQRVWVDGAIFRVFAVTNAEYLNFLNALVRTGRESEALRYAPRERAGGVGEQGALIFDRDGQGLFLLRPDSDGDEWLPEQAVGYMDWYCAMAYARWEAARTGQPWRLPFDLEWEKAARGVDGRIYPWGHQLDPSWACYLDSHVGRPQPPVVDSYPVDESPYGVRGMAGNSRDWCQEIAQLGRSVVRNGRLVREEQADVAGTNRAVRGGSFGLPHQYTRLANRWSDPPLSRGGDVGFRLVRSLP